VRHANKK
jgi:2,4-dienoyl-CoA reductase-like NADH-dependent reductase (Old Yellow Enzyme family)